MGRARAQLGIEYGTTGLTAVLVFPDEQVTPLRFAGSTRTPTCVALTRRGTVVSGVEAQRLCLHHPQRYLPAQPLTVFTHGAVLGRRTVGGRDVAAAAMRPVWREAITMVGRRAISGVAVAMALPVSWCDRDVRDAAGDLGMPAPILTDTGEALADLALTEIGADTGEAIVAVARVDGAGALEFHLLRYRDGLAQCRLMFASDPNPKLVNQTTINDLIRRARRIVGFADPARLSVVVCQAPAWAHPHITAELGNVAGGVPVLTVDDHAPARGAVMAWRRDTVRPSPA